MCTCINIRLMDLFEGDVEANQSKYLPSNMDCSSTVIRVKTIHISSPILAARSPFFYKV